MQRLFLMMCLIAPLSAFASDFDSAVNAVRDNCSHVANDLDSLKRMAGINTAISSVGAVASGAGLGAGIAKAQQDAKLSAIDNELAQGLTDAGFTIISDTSTAVDKIAEFLRSTELPNVKTAASALQDKRDKIIAKSTTLGNVRTGLLAGATVANVAGAAIATNNKSDGLLWQDLSKCIASVKDLSNLYMQARISSDTTIDLSSVQDIISACSAVDRIDLAKIDGRASGATGASVVGASFGAVGTITSALANTQRIRNDITASGQATEKKLNTTANIMAGGATVAGTTATIFNASQIRAINSASDIVEHCMGVLDEYK